MRPREVIESLVGAVKDTGRLPSEMNYVGYEPNIDTEAIKLPMLEVNTLSEARISEHNTDEVGVKQDSDGNDVGRVFHALYQLTVEVNVWTAQGSKYDPDVLGDQVYASLYNYDSSGPKRSLADDVWRVRVGDGEPDPDFATSPTLRRWSQEVEVWAYESFSVDEDYIVNVVAPADGDFSDTSATGTIDNA